MSNLASITPHPAALSLAELIAQRATYKADAEYIGEQIELIDSQIIDRLRDVGTHDVDGTKVEIREYSRIDMKAVEAAYPAADFPQLYSSTPALDSAAVKKQFAPAVLDQFKVIGKKSVVIK